MSETQFDTVLRGGTVLDHASGRTQLAPASSQMTIGRPVRESSRSASTLSASYSPSTRTKLARRSPVCSL